MSAEKQSTEIGLMTYREDVFLIISLKTVFENLRLVKSYNKTNLNVFVPCLREKYRWGLTSFGQYTWMFCYTGMSLVLQANKCSKS